MGRKKKEVIVSAKDVKFAKEELENFFFAVKGNVIPWVAQATGWIKLGIEIGKWKSVKEGCNELGISTSSYYNYKDRVKLMTVEEELEETKE